MAAGRSLWLMAVLAVALVATSPLPTARAGDEATERVVEAEQRLGKRFLDDPLLRPHLMVYGWWVKIGPEHDHAPLRQDGESVVEMVERLAALPTGELLEQAEKMRALVDEHVPDAERRDAALTTVLSGTQMMGFSEAEMAAFREWRQLIATDPAVKDPGTAYWERLAALPEDQFVKEIEKIVDFMNGDGPAPQ